MLLDSILEGLLLTADETRKIFYRYPKLRDGVVYGFNGKQLLIAPERRFSKEFVEQNDIKFSGYPDFSRAIAFFNDQAARQSVRTWLTVPRLKKHIEKMSQVKGLNIGFLVCGCVYRFADVYLLVNTANRLNENIIFVRYSGALPNQSPVKNNSSFPNCGFFSIGDAQILLGAETVDGVSPGCTVEMIQSFKGTE